MTRRDDEAAAALAPSEEECLASLRALRCQGVPPRAVDASLREFARDVWLLLRDADEEELRRATEATEIECNVQLAGVTDGPLPTPMEAAAMPAALFGAVNIVRMVLRTGVQGAAERRLGHELTREEYCGIALLLLKGHEVTGAELAERLELSEATVSRRLRKLRDMGAVQTVRGTRSAHSALTREAARALGSMDAEEILAATRTFVRRRLNSRLAEAERVDVAVVESEKVKLERSGSIPVGDVSPLMSWSLHGSDR